MEICLAVTFDGNYIMQAKVLLQSIISSKKEETKIKVFVLVPHSFPKDVIRDFKLSFEGENRLSSIEFFHQDTSFDSFHTESHLPTAAYFRIRLPSFLSDLDKCLYLDIDMIVESDLSDLYSIDLKEHYLAAVRHSSYDHITELYSFNFKKFNYFNSGVLLLNLKKLRNDDIERKLMSLISCHNFHCLDQDALNIACFGNVHFLPLKYNFMTKMLSGKHRYYAKKNYGDEFKEAFKRPVIIHYAGKEKPWDYKNIPMTERWNFYHQVVYKYPPHFATKSISINQRMRNLFSYLVTWLGIRE